MRSIRARQITQATGFRLAEVHITHEGIPEVIPVEACYLGWQESLVLMAKLVEAEVPG